MSAPGTNKFWNYQVQRLLAGGAYFKIRELNNITCQKLIIVSFK